MEVSNMRVSSARRLILACVISAAAVAALAAPGAASAANSDLGEWCSGTSIKGLGSSFQAPAQKIWDPGFNTSENATACKGAAPTATYEQTQTTKGSGACIKAIGAEKELEAKWGEFGYCGTDEAPNAQQKKEMEEKAEEVEGKKAEAKSLETLPVAQGAVAVIVHLPEGCLSESEVPSGATKVKLGRLVFDQATVEGIFRGTINTWKEAVEAQKGDGNDKLTCKGGTAEEEKEIKRIVRLDHSGTTHIFKTFLSLINGTEFEAEVYPEEVGGKKTGCGKELPAKELRTWKDVDQACENQRWPEAAKVIRPAISGNPGVVGEVAKTESSIGYADLAVARENGEFSKKYNKTTKTGGGENKKGTETVRGEQNTRFWARIQDTAATPITYADPSSDGDVEKVANSNCAGTVYTEEAGKKFPPSSTRELWNEAKAELTEKNYSVCGVTYDLAPRQFKFFHGTTKEEATTVSNFLLFEINSKTGGGGALLKNHDYEALSSSILEETEDGIEEIGFAVGGGAFRHRCAETTENTGTKFYKTKEECEFSTKAGTSGKFERKF